MSDKNLSGRTSMAVEHISLKLRKGSVLEMAVISAEVECEALGMAQISWIRDGKQVKKANDRGSLWFLMYRVLVAIWWR